MRNLMFAIVGTVFGLILTKAEIVSWFRIQEMFRFQSIHMYGFIVSAIAVASVSVMLIKKFQVKSIFGEKLDTVPISVTPGNIIGGIIFGLGWALVGACPGPMFALLGGGYFMVLYIILGAFLGLLVYGILSQRLP